MHDDSNRVSEYDASEDEPTTETDNDERGEPEAFAFRRLQTEDSKGEARKTADRLIQIGLIPEPLFVVEDVKYDEFDVGVLTPLWADEDIDDARDISVTVIDGEHRQYEYSSVKEMWGQTP